MVGYRNIVQLKDIKMFYLDNKNTKAKETIICLHGRWGRGETWAHFMEHYGDKYRIIAPDQRGHGLSSKPIGKYTDEEMAGDIIQLLDYLDLSSVILVGHSMGGSIAGYIAANYPQYIKAVAILDKSAAGSSPAIEKPVDESKLVDSITKDWPMPFSTLYEAKSFIKSHMDSDISYDYFLNSLTEDEDGYKMMFSSQAMGANEAYYEEWYDLLPKIKCLTLLIRSGSHIKVKDDEFIKMQSLLKNCIAHEMSHPDHNVHLSNEGEFYSYFDEFLKCIEQK